MLTILLIYDRWTVVTKTSIDKIDRLIYMLSVLWVFIHALTHIRTCYTTELMRSNMWLDIIVHHTSTILTLIAYNYRQNKENEKIKRSTLEYKLTLIYLIFIALYSFLSIYVSIKYVETVEDGDRLAVWWIGAGLSFVNFSTVNVYGQNIFSQRFIAELIHGSFVFVVQTSDLIAVQSFVSRNYFETHLFGALVYNRYIYVEGEGGYRVKGS